MAGVGVPHTQTSQKIRGKTYGCVLFSLSTVKKLAAKTYGCVYSKQWQYGLVLGQLQTIMGLRCTTATLRTIEPISKVERYIEKCDVPEMLYELNVTVS